VKAIADYEPHTGRVPINKILRWIAIILW